MKTVGLEVWFTGHVQGVGFRYTTLQIAKGFDVVGEVKNLSDGRVYLQAQGEEKEVIAFKEEIEEQMASYIKKVEVALKPISQKMYSAFEITQETSKV